MSEKPQLTPEEIAMLDPSEAYKYGYRTAIKDLSGGDIENSHQKLGEARVSQSTLNSYKELLQEAEQQLNEARESAGIFAKGFVALQEIILASGSKAQQFLANQIPVPPTEKELSIEAQCNE